MYHLTRVDCTYKTDFCVRQRCKAKPFVLFQLLCSGVLDAITVNVRNDTCAFPGLTFAIRHEVRFVIKKEVRLEISVKMHKSMCTFSNLISLTLVHFCSCARLLIKYKQWDCENLKTDCGFSQNLQLLQMHFRNSSKIKASWKHIRVPGRFTPICFTILQISHWSLKSLIQILCSC